VKGYRCYLYMCLVVLVTLRVLPLHAQTPSNITHPPLQQQGTPGPYTKAVLAPEEIFIDAKSAILIEATTGKVLLSHNVDMKIPPASFAKLMTLYILFDLIKQQKVQLSDEVFVSKNAWRTPGSKMFIEVNTKVSIEDLIKGVAIVSGNDACVAIAEHLYGDIDTFTSVMNKYAQTLGMQNSQFANPHGLPSAKQFTTVQDMALLARSYVNTFPEAMRFHSMQEFTYAGIRQDNRNGLLKKDDAIDGLKTGWVEESGYHLLATAVQENLRLLAVVMGAPSPSVREREALKLLHYGYRNFALLPFFSAGQVVTELAVWKGKANSLPVVVLQNSAVVIPRGQEQQVGKESLLPTDIMAPVEQGQVLGEFVVHLKEQTLASVPLVAGKSISRAGLIKSASHHVYLFGRNHKKRLAIITGSMVSLGVVAMFVFFGRKRRRTPRFRF
jgi:serine-type D-Ala-D-Ala carboxypeptidase (penicillin-binding protein 5/6)